MTELVDAQYYASLKTTLVPTNGAGNPTFTRATTKNVFDNEGKLKTLKSGAVTMSGARVVQNLFASVNNMNSASWIAGGATSKAAALGPGGVSGGVLLTATSNAANSYYQGVNQSSIPGSCNTRTDKFLYYPGSATWIVYYVYDGGSNRSRVWFNATTHVIGSTSNLGSGYTLISTALNASVNYPGWYEFSVVATVPLTGTIYHQFNQVDADNSTNTTSVSGRTITLIFPQLENTTSQADKTASEYVSVGVLSAPFHGAGVDGVKYFDTNKDLTAIPDATMLGAHIDPASKTNNLLWCRDLTNAAWVKTNATAAKTQTGIDGLASGCSLLTATAADATCLQTITAAATAACSGFWVKRSVGTGSIFFTRNGGVDWLDITSLINSSTFTCVKIENTSVTNPQVGFKIATSGDAIIVDAGLNHAGTTLTLPIFTTSAAVTRAADVLTYQTASNFSDTAGTILATYKPTYDTYASGSIVGSSTRGLYASTSNSGVQALDGTNTINGPSGTPSGQIRIGARWSGSSLQCFALDSFGSSGSYDGSFNLSTIGILPGTAGYIRDLAIWTSSLTDNEIRDAWSLITASSYITSGSLVGMQSILSSSASSISTVIYGSITATYAQPVIMATYVQPTLTATYTVPTIEAEP